MGADICNFIIDEARVKRQATEQQQNKGAEREKAKCRASAKPQEQKQA